jgi:hypothetical protein
MHPTTRYNTMVLADERRRLLHRPRLPRLAWEVLGDRLLEAARQHRQAGELGRALFCADRAVDVMDRAARPIGNAMARVLVVAILRDKADLSAAAAS